MSSAKGTATVQSGTFAYGALDDLEAYIREQERAAEEAARKIELQCFLEEEEAARAAYLEGSVQHQRDGSHAVEDVVADHSLEAHLEEATDILTKAEFQLASANYTEALRLARSTLGLLDELGNARGTATCKAQVAQVIVRAHIAEEDFDVAFELAHEQLQYFRRYKFEEAEVMTSVAIAEVLLAMGRPKSGLTAASAALAHSKRLQDRALTASALQMLARVQLRLGHAQGIAAALTEAEEAIALHQQLGNAKDEAAALLLMCKVRTARQEHEEAFECASMSGEISRNVGCKKGEAAAWREAAAVMLAAGIQLEEALDFASEAVNLSDGSDPLGEIAAHQAVASVHQSSDRPREALEALEMALSLARELPDRCQIQVTLDTMIHIHISTGSAEEALQLARSELQSATASGEVRRLLGAFQRTVSVLLSLQRSEEALRVAHEAVDALGAFGNKRIVAKALQLVAEVQAAARHHKRALAVVSTALAHLKEVGSVQDLLAIWQLMFVLHTEMGSSEQALKSRMEEQKVCRRAGWKEEEAAVALSISELVLPLHGPEEAVSAAREALTTFEDLDDKQGKASALLRLAELQALSGATDEAAGNLLSARRLFQSFSDVKGECDALLLLADAYFQKGRGDQALRLARDALALCRNAGDGHLEATVLQALANMQVALIQRRAESGQMPETQAVKDALDSCKNLAEMCNSVGDVAGHALALVLLSNAHVANKDGEDALQAAGESSRLARELNDVKLMGSAKLALAQSHLLLGEGGSARKAAEEAVPHLKEVADGPGVEKARQIVLLAHTAKRSAGSTVRTPKAVPAHTEPLPSPPSAPSDSQTPSQQARHPRVVDPGRQTPNGSAGLTVRTDGSQVKAKTPKKGVAGPAGIRSILLVVWPGCTTTDLQLAQERFGKIGIESMSDLFSHLRTAGVQGINERFRAAGCLEMDEKILEGLCEVACRGMSEYE